MHSKLSRLAWSLNEYNDLNNLSSSERIRWKTRGEGRSHERAQLTMPVLIIRRSAGGEQFDAGISIDKTELGVGFETEANLKPGNLVELVFDLNEDSEYRRDARLLYRLDLRYGAYFTKLD